MEDHGQPREGSFLSPLAGAGEVTAGTQLSGEMGRAGDAPVQGKAKK